MHLYGLDYKQYEAAKKLYPPTLIGVNRTVCFLTNLRPSLQSYIRYAPLITFRKL